MITINRTMLLPLFMAALCFSWSGARGENTVSNRQAAPSPALTAFTPETASAAFDQLWEAFDRDYAMFVLRPEVDWAQLREQWRPLAVKSASPAELANVCAELLKPLRDLHIYVRLNDKALPVFNRPRSANANWNAISSLLGELHGGHDVAWTLTTNNIGYIQIAAWIDDETPGACDEALEQMRDTRGLVVDVRLNGGGSEALARKVAGRFVDKEFVYSNSQFRNGPAHTNLTEKFPRVIRPRGLWRYNRPVMLLIGQNCMSSNESFIAMMTGDPLVTTMGDHTCGSSGNPKRVELPFGITATLPQWIDYRPDGIALDERGLEPQIPFKPAPGAFEGGRDDLLAAALARLALAPLPAKPIQVSRSQSSEAELNAEKD